MKIRQKCQFPQAFQHFIKNPDQPIQLHEWANLEAKMAHVGWNPGSQDQALNVAKMGHFSSRLASEMASRQNVNFSLVGIMANPHISRNGPSRKPLTAQNRPRQRRNPALKTGPEMLQKWAILARD